MSKMDNTNNIDKILDGPKNISEYSQYTEIKLLGKGVTSQVYLVKKDDKYYVAKKINFVWSREITKKRIHQVKPDIYDIKRIVNIMKKLTFGKNIEQCQKYFECYVDSFIDKTNNIFIILTTYINGIPLLKFYHKLVYIERKFSSTTIVKIAKDVCESLAYLHTNGIIHGDLHMENIIYDIETNRFKLIDFGYSCGCTDHMLTATTPPETFFSHSLQVQKQEHAKDLPGIYWHNIRRYKMDMWSLGYILYILATGKPLNDSMTMSKKLLDIIGYNISTIEKRNVKYGDNQQYILQAENGCESTVPIDFSAIDDKFIKYMLKVLLEKKWQKRFDYSLLFNLILEIQGKVKDDIYKSINLKTILKYFSKRTDTKKNITSKDSKFTSSDQDTLDDDVDYNLDANLDDDVDDNTDDGPDGTAINSVLRENAYGTSLEDDFVENFSGTSFKDDAVLYSELDDDKFKDSLYGTPQID